MSYKSKQKKGKNYTLIIGVLTLVCLFFLQSSLKITGYTVADVIQEIESNIEEGIEIESPAESNEEVTELPKEEPIIVESNESEVSLEINDSSEKNNTTETNITKPIEINNTESNVTIQDKNDTKKEVEIVSDVILEKNDSIENKTIIYPTIEQGDAILNEKVKWEDYIGLEQAADIIFEIPEKAENLSIIKNGKEENIELKEEVSNKEGKKEIRFSAEKESNIKIEYYTEAPYSKEEISKNKKIVRVFSEEHYKDVLIFTNISEIQASKENLAIFWVEENKYVEQIHPEDSNQDYIYWIASHLSNQTFIIIEITDALHLDSNRTFISNIYNETIALDDVWSETIPDSHYVRVTFETNLTNVNDITIYPRIVSGNPIIEVYENNGNTIIAQFDNITSNQYNKIYLTQLTNSQDTFDLQVVGGSIEFDHIIDPITTIFSDDFETNLAKWDGNGVTAWDLTTVQEHGGAQSVQASNGNEGDLITDDIDTSDATFLNVSFWYRDDDLDSTDIDLYFFDGSAYDAVTENLEGLTEDTWHFISFTTTDSQYFKSNFRVRFNAVLGSGETFWVDDFTVNKTTPETIPPEVTINFPEEDAIYHFHLDLPLNFNVTLNENGSVSYSLDNGVNNVTMNGNEGIFGTSFTAANSSLALGDYLFKVYANDTSGNVNYTEVINFSVIQENLLVNGTVIDSSGEEVNTTFIVINEIEEVVIYNETNLNHEAIIPLNNTYTLEILPLDFPSVDKIEMNNLNFSEVNETSIEVIQIEESNETGNFDTVFSVKPLFDEFENGTVFFTAQANSLFRCFNWNFSAGFCDGEWNLLMKDLSIGQEYNFTFSGKRGYGIIEITNATHLDENRSYISNIYNETITLDDLWSETIPDSHYVRVTFETNLTNVNDITIYPRVVSGTPVVNVYEIDSDVLLEQFSNIVEQQYYTIYLTNLTGTQDTFDLEVVGGSLEFDHIIDPTLPINGNASDIALGPIDSERFVMVYVNNTGNSVQFMIKNTNGTHLVGPVTVATGSGSGYNSTNYNITRVGVAVVNTTSFVVGWTNLSAEWRAGFTTLGTYYFSPATSDGSIGTTFHDISLTAFNSTLIAYCYVDQAEGDHDMRRFSAINGALVGAETDINTAMTPETNLNNIQDCVAVNETTIAAFEYHATTSDDATYHLVNHAGTEVLADLDIDAAVGTGAQVATTALDDNKYVLAWYDQADGDITISINRTFATSLLPVTDIDTVAGTTSRLALATVKNTSTNTDNFVVVYYNQTGTDIVARFYNGSGTALRAPLVVESNPSTTPFIMSALGRNSATGISLCDETWLVGYTNVTGRSIIKTYWLNGTEWDGSCPDLDFPQINITYPPNNSIFTTQDVVINYTVSDANLESCWYTNSSGIFNYSLTCGQNISATWTEGINNITIYANDTSNNINSSSVGFITDTIFPIVNIISPGNITYNSLPIIFNISSSENSTANYSLTNGLLNYTMTVNSTGTGFNATNSSIADGQYTARFFVQDIAGNMNSSTNVTFSIDTINPTINLVSPTESSGVSRSRNYIEINVTASDINLANITIRLFNSSHAINQTNTSLLNPFYINYSQLSDGLYFYNATAADGTNNLNSTETRNITLDRIFPQYSNLNETPTNGTAYSSGTRYQFNMTWVDINIQSVLIEFNGTNYTPSNNGNVYNLSIYDLAAGNYNYYWRANDSAGNTNITSIQTYTISKAASEVNTYLNHSRANITIEEDSSIYLNSTRISGEGLIRLYNDGNLINEGTPPLSNLTLFSSIGLFNITTIQPETQNHTQSSETFYVNVTEISDAEYPLFTNFNENPSNNTAYVNNALYRFNTTITRTNATAGIEFNGINYTSTNLSTIFNSTISNLGAGAYNYYWWAYGNGTNHLYNKSEIRGYTISKASQQITPLLNGNNGNLIVTYPQQINASYSGTNQTALTIRINGTLMQIAQNTTIGVGFWTVNYSAPTNQNYSTFLDFLNLTVNQASGDVEIYLNGNTNNITAELGSTVTINASRLSGETPFTLYLDSSSIASGTATTNSTQITSLSSKNLTAVLPQSQNYTSETLTRWIDVIDTTRPQINTTLPLNTSYNSIQTRLNYTVFDLDLQACWYTTNSGLSNTTVTCGTNVTSLSSNQGSNTWTVYSNDTSGNTNSSSVTFFVDSLFPDTQYVTPTEANNSILTRNNILINVTATDSNLANITIRLFNSSFSLNQTNTSSTSPLFINVTNLLDGRYYFNATATDSQNNQNTTETRTITIDTARPSISYVSPTETNNSILTRNNILINITASDTNLQAITIRLYNSSFGITQTNISASSPLFVNATNLADGRYYFNATANDTAGNHNNTETRTILIDRTNPQINITYPSNNSIFTTNNVTINYTVSDANLQACWYTNSSGRFNTTLTCGTNLSLLWFEGVNNITLYSNDTAGNRNSSSVKFTVDTIFPAITINSPTTNLSVSSVTFNITSSESADSGIYTLNNGLTNITMQKNANVNFNHTNSSIADGTYLVKFSVNDTAGNTNTTNTTFTVDTTNPLISFGIGTENNNSFVSRNSIYTNVSLTETNFANITYTLFNSSSLFNRTTFSSLTLELNFTNLIDGAYRYNVSVRDTLNRFNVTETRIITLDTINPSVIDTATPSSPTTYSQGATYYFNATITDTNSISAVLFDFNGVNRTATNLGNNYNVTLTNLAAGTYPFRWYVNDSAGNVNSSESGNYVINKASGNIALLLNGTSGDINLTYPARVNASTTSTSSTITLLLNGTDVTSQNHLFNNISANYWNFTAIAAENQNYTSATISRFANLSKGIPQGTISISPSNTVTYGTETTTTASESNSGDADLTYTLYSNDISVSNPHTTTQSAGTYNYKFNATEGQNWTSNSSLETETLTVNQATSEVRTFINNTRANITVEVNTNLLLNSSLFTGQFGTLNLTVNNVQVNSSNSNMINNYNFTELGTFKIASNYSGNTNYTSDFEEWNVSVIDSTSPRVFLGSPTNGTQIISNTTSFSASFTDNYNLLNASLNIWNISGSLIGVNSTNISNKVNSTTRSFTFPYEGIFFWNYRVYDNSSNFAFNNTNRTLIFNTTDVTNPLVTIISPEETTYSSSTIEFNVSLNENGSVQYTIDDNENITMTGNEGIFGTDFNYTTNLSDGEYTFRVYANDTTGNRNDSESIDFSINTQQAVQGSPGSGGDSSVLNFSVSPDFLQVKIKQGDFRREKLVVENIGTKKVDFTIEVDNNLKRFILIDEGKFEISRGKKKEITLDLFSSETEPANLYAGKINFVNEELTISSRIVLEIQEKRALFDITSEIQGPRKKFYIFGDRIFTTSIKMMNLGDLERSVDVTLEYFIQDFNNKSIKIKEETLAINRELEIERTFEIPEDIESGEYLFYVRLSQGGSIATSGNRLLIEEKTVNSTYWIIIAAIIAAIGIFGVQIRGGLKLALTKAEVEYLRAVYSITSIKTKYEAGIYDERIGEIERIPRNFLGSIMNYYYDIKARLLQLKYKILLLKKTHETGIERNIFRSISYIAIKAFYAVKTRYYRLKYKIKLIKKEYELGFYDSNILTIKHLPRNIIGSISKALSNLNARFMQLRYKLRIKMHELGYY